VTGLGLFLFGAFGLYVLSTWLTVLQLRLSRRMVALYSAQLLGMAAGTAALAWWDQTSQLSLAQVWVAVGLALLSSLAVNVTARWLRRS
jgi:hypothetical protein